MERDHTPRLAYKYIIGDGVGMCWAAGQGTLAQTLCSIVVRASSKRCVAKVSGAALGDRIEVSLTVGRQKWGFIDRWETKLGFH